jgi:hypothetical protein
LVADRVAIVFCVHHKPWLMMSTLVTTLIQDCAGVDLHFAHNVGDGRVSKPSYAEYYRTAEASGVNVQLSDYDERVRDICRVNRRGVFDVEYENDHALDSGTWYKFIRDGKWREYDYVLFAGEGALFSRSTSLAGMLAFARRCDAHVIASGHEKRRIPKDIFLRYCTRDTDPSPLDRLHDRMIHRTFEIFRRDDTFDRVFQTWGSDFALETQDHVPDIPPHSPLGRRLRTLIGRRWGTVYGARARGVRWPARLIQQLPIGLDYAVSRASMLRNGGGPTSHEPPDPTVVVSGQRRHLSDVVATETELGVRFHRVQEPEWFGCGTIHLMSRRCLTDLAAKLEEFRMYDVLGLPFAATGLEVVWGFLPAWLGYQKWFTDGIHRPRKNFVSYTREDYPPEMASYINRYHRGRISVGWDGDFLKLRALRPELAGLRQTLPDPYF